MTAKPPISRLLLRLLIALPIWVSKDEGGHHHHVAAFVVDLPRTCWSSRKHQRATVPPVTGLPLARLKRCLSNHEAMGSRLSSCLLVKRRNGDESPGTRIMRQFEAMEREKKKKQFSTTGGTPTPSAGDGEGDSPLEKAFRLVKDGTYGVVDKVAELSGKPRTAVEPTPSEGTASSGGPVELSLYEDLDAETQSLRADLSSSNPITKLRAEVAMKNIEARRNMRAAAATTEEVFSTAKDTVYSVIDFAKEAPTKIADTASKVKETTESTAKAIQEVPANIESTVEGVKRTTELTTKAIQEIPSRVENTIEEVKATPRKVQAKVEEVNAGIEDAKQKVAGAVEAVRSIPSNVQNTIENARAAVDDIGSKIEQVRTSAKVLTGMEEPKKPPPPPKMPPPPPSQSEMAFQVTKDVVGGIGKGAWTVGKGLLDLGASTVKNVADKSSDAAKSDQGLEKQEAVNGSISDSVDAATTKTGKASISGTKASPKLKTGENDDKKLKREVADALQLAEDALRKSDKKVSDSDGG